MPNLEDAILLALKSYQGQKDKAGAPYILHPLRVMLSMETETEMIVAVLHDVVEDGGITISDLRKAGYPEEILIPIDCLIRHDGEGYNIFVARLKDKPLGGKVERFTCSQSVNAGKSN